MKRGRFIKVILTALPLGGIFAKKAFSFTNHNERQEEDSYEIKESSLEKVGSIPSSKPVVYMTKDISPESLLGIYKALGHNLTGKVAVKIHTGEPGNRNYLKPDLMKELVQSVNGTLVECNVAYPGERFTASAHKKVAADHGFTSIANIDIMDENGSITLPFARGRHLKEDFVGAHFKNYDSYIILSHFKGHGMAGFGGALKNMAIGIASAEGKMWIHTAGTTKSTANMMAMFQTKTEDFLESIAEASGAVMDSLGDRVVYINVMNKLSVNCDCEGQAPDPTMKDIGILASLDPVALDQACVDLVVNASDGKDLVDRMNSRNGIHTLEYATQLGLGSRQYEIKSLDK